MKRATLLLVLSVVTNYPALAVPDAVPPAQAKAAGFSNLLLDQEFQQFDLSSLDKTVWWTKVFYNAKSKKKAEEAYDLLSEGGLAITSGSIINHPPNFSAYGPDYHFGYFEAKMRFSSKANVTNSFGAFWMLSKSHLEQKDYDAKRNEVWCELDIFEAFGHNAAANTVHFWSHPKGAPTTNKQNSNALSRGLLIDPIDGKWHIFGVLWEPGKATWYIDNVKISTAATYPVCDLQPQTLIVSAQSHRDDAQETDVAWVRVWQ